MFGLGVTELIIILVLILIMFGAGKLPKVMGDVAKGVKNFKQGMKEDGTEDASTNKAIGQDGNEPVAGTTQKDETAKS